MINRLSQNWFGVTNPGCVTHCDNLPVSTRRWLTIWHKRRSLRRINIWTAFGATPFSSPGYTASPGAASATTVADAEQYRLQAPRQNPVTRSTNETTYTLILPEH